MILPRETSGAATLERIAEGFRRRGYEVVVQPTAEQRPSFLSDFTPDMIAHRGDEHLVIDVKNAPQEVEGGQLSALSSLVSAHPGWRFILMAPPPKEKLFPGESLRVMTQEEIQRGLEEARTLEKTGHPEAALLLAWAAIEASLRLLSYREGISLGRPDTGTLLRNLASEGLLDRDTFQRLNDLFKLRSVLAHGFVRDLREEAADTSRMLRDIWSLSNTLQNELRKSPWIMPAP
jgi:Holliday junction resolvase